MPSDAKRAAVAEMVELFSTSERAIVSDYRGLSVSDLGALRASLREHGITFRVVKNRLAKIAAAEAGRADLSSLLEGPSAIVVGGADEVLLAKALIEAVRPYRNLVIRGGIISGSRIDSAGLARLAALPGRDQLLAQLAGGMIAPLATLASLLGAPIRNLAYALAQVRDRREQAGSTEPEPTGASAPDDAAAEPPVEGAGASATEGPAPAEA